LAYVIGAAVITLAGVLTVALVLTGVAPEYTDTNRDALLVGGLTLLGIGNLLWRVLCEMVMLLFRILEVLLELDDKARSLIGLLAERKRNETTAPAIGQDGSRVGGAG
jgi:ABC-type branched-subunit amino acid transport system permease subunit